MPSTTRGFRNSGRDEVEIRLSEVIAALSYALDLTGGQPEGHASRSCLLGMRIAQELRLSADDCSALFYALLLKDLGCSTNASKMCYLFGVDDQLAKRESKTVEWTRTIPSAKYVMSMLRQNHASFLAKTSQFVKLAIEAPKASRELIAMRCERGAKIASDLQLPQKTSIAIRSLDEHWDGRGHPDGLKGDEIPVLSQILGIAQTFEVFATHYGLSAACSMACDRSGTWFNPMLVRTLLSFEHDTIFWNTYFSHDPQEAVTAYEPGDHTLTADNATLDRIAHGFAQVIDAKSPWTFRHSEGVSTIAAGIAGAMNMSADQVRDIRRAGLLHDVGKLGVSNMILDKPGKLNDAEMAEMRKHTDYTYHILQRVSGFRDLASMAAAHHERLDGKGYHLGLAGAKLGISERILAVADIFEALTAKRPYRQDLSRDEVMSILHKSVGTGICPVAFAGLQTYLRYADYVPSAIAA